MQDLDMKTTRANVEEYAKQMGYEPIQIDSIPEGFCFKKPDLVISQVLYPGNFVAFVPLSEWENESVVQSETIAGLLELYKVALKTNGK